MKLNKFFIKNLFGVFTYSIDFAQDANPLIITGLNGYGKTTILTIISKLSKGDLFYFYSLPFSELKIVFDNLHILEIIAKKEDTDKAINDENTDSNLTASRIVTFTWKVNDTDKGKMVLNADNIHAAVRRIGFYRRTDYLDIHNLQNYESDDFYEFVKENTYFYQYFKEKEGVNLIFMMLESFKSTFIEAQRIIVENTDNKKERRSERFVSNLSQISEALKKMLDEKRFNYLKISQDKDKQIIEQLLAPDSVNMNEDDYDCLKSEMEGKIEELLYFELIERTKIKSYDKDNSHILTVYLINLREKLKEYDEVLPKLQLFRSMIESLHFINKKIIYNPQKGIVVINSDGSFLDIEKLSSGEKNEIVMLYYMIFKVDDDTVLLIDEPEISLHVAWQNDFMDNIEKIAKSKRLQVLIATHSPQIIGDRWEECYDLCESVEA